MKVVLVAATPAEHAAGVDSLTGARDFAAESYNYAIGRLKACALAGQETEQGLEIELLDFPVPRVQQTLSDSQYDEISSHKPDVVGFSSYCWSVDLFLDAAARMKSDRPEVVTLFGGPSIKRGDDGLVARNPQVDLAVVGEAELAFAELCRRRFAQPDGIPNVVARASSGQVVDCGPDQVVEDFSALPSAYLDGALRPSSAVLLVEPSRGCRFRCSFCSWSTRAGHMRYARPERLAAELQWAVTNGYRGANFCDTAINHSTGHLRSFCDTVRRADPDRRLSNSVFLRHEELDNSQIEILSRIRCDEIIMGLESIHAEALRRCAKPPLNCDQFERKLESLRRAGHRVTLSIMSGLPGDSLAGFAATLDYLDDLLERIGDTVNFVCCFWLAVLPGTRFADRADEYGFTTRPRGTPYIESSKDFSPEDLHEAATMLVDRCGRNPRFRCEEIHREVASSPRPGRQRVASCGGSANTPAASARSPAGGSVLTRSWPQGQVRNGWVLAAVVAPSGGEGLCTFRFEIESGGPDPTAGVEVTVAPADPSRPCYARTLRYNIFYRGQNAREVPEDALEQLLGEVIGIIRRNEA